jgi:hypothetical protein
MAINLTQYTSTLNNNILKARVHGSLLNQINTLGIPTSATSIQDKNIMHILANGFEVQQLINRVFSTIIANNSIDSTTTDENTIDSAVGTVWQSLFGIAL